jgi:hypothetical protein
MAHASMLLRPARNSADMKKSSCTLV